MKSNYLKYVCLCIFLLASSLSADWSDPIPIPDSSSYAEVEVVVDPAGNATAIWNRGTFPRTIETASKTVDGVWSLPETISNIGQNTGFLSLVVDPAGNVTAVWLALGANSDLQSANKLVGEDWGSVETLNSSTELSPTPRLTVDAAGNVTVLFREIMSGKIQSVNKPFGGSWSDAEDVSDNAVNSSFADVTTTAAGVLTAIWVQGGSVLQSKSKNFGSNWGDVEEIPSSGPNLSNPRLTVDEAGNVTAIWLQGISPSVSIQTSTKPSGGNWEPATNLTTVGSLLSAPNLTVDQAGNVTAIWTGNDVIQSATKPLGGSWSTVSDISISGQQSTGADITVDQYGNVTAVWLTATAGIGTFQSAVKPIGGNWSSVIDLSPTAGILSFPFFDIDTSGRITALWGQAGTLQSRTYQPPVVTTLSPNIGPTNGGNIVEITGNGFGSATEVLFGTARATIIANSPTSITVIAPQGDMSSVDVRVVTSNGIVSPQNADSLYTYIPSTEIHPPSNFVGKIKKNIFLNKTDQILKATWTPSSSSDVAYYVIYKGNLAVNFVQANGPFIFQDAIKSKSTNYLIKAVGTNGLESALVPLVLLK